MNRVKKISRRYAEHRPQFDNMRAIRSHTRRMRKTAVIAREAGEQLLKLKAAFESMTLKELKKLAAHADIKGRSKMNKKELQEALLKPR